ncbi:hypothetical protein C343_06263 [Cryptococcus neoformans C23]|uniref:Uncharacterized protein n=2 Tax=Cryptococcus neoformans TaxID=5207 RepID=A0A854Q559_CRYNE|nr:hypothetical protein CNAG_07900 [Cryptococcus neoformans var. grubii H99]AUB28408.1 hypothetical protein CKF44_07900 [Cryptococcus neoformans var. grubii]OWZ27094.1 hypothetical protein C347_06263 [Cryptococcus neoformans var. grubii AD2-60a]OWZ39056.1 hypothetical protein C343_06263 [Cryptococcus neoformans var. grubii C23]OXG11359.1 hypothetical protein C361_06463 [Cryptococcus neoformans var. grubii Tu259-1]AFR98286.1 hypothetical protein CNAG_07900 [Cryptococcus neoformans var. grubii H|eukprot:XP_012053249.1 hypothetical protein CNAG_07900 [Cryptococcus neoformans var. grubii H99]
MPHLYHNTLLPNPQPRHRSRSPCRSSTSPTRQYHRQCAPVMPIPSSPLNPNPPSRSNMMMYNPYQWGGGMMGGQGVGYPGMQNPYMTGRDPSVMGSMPAPSQSAAGTEDRNLRPFDSSKMKQGRLGHYGYLEGRELAGPPVGHLPAGIQSQYSSSQAGHGTLPAGPCSTASYQGNGSWGDMANIPRARYDGAASATGYVQADLDSPYPRAPNGSVTTAWTRYGADGSVMDGMNGNGATGRRRVREGRV